MFQWLGLLVVELLLEMSHLLATTQSTQSSDGRHHWPGQDGDFWQEFLIVSGAVASCSVFFSPIVLSFDSILPNYNCIPFVVLVFGMGELGDL